MISQNLQSYDKHVCCCNLCGLDMQAKAEEVASSKIEQEVSAFKAQMRNQPSESNDKAGNKETSEETKQKIEELEQANSSLKTELENLS